MNEKKEILKFLNRHYRIYDNSFFDVNLDKKIYGSDILEHLTVVFSNDENLNKELIKEWALKTITLECFENNWEFKNTISTSDRWYEPKRMNRFIVRFPEDYNIPAWFVFEASRPSANVIDRKLFGLEWFKTIKWNDLIVKMRDPIGPSTSQAIMELIYKNYYTKKRRIKEKFTLIIEMLDPVGHVVEKWELDNCEIKSVDFGSLIYESDSAVTCTLTIKLKDVFLLF